MVKLIIILAIAGLHFAHAQEGTRGFNERLFAFRALEQDIEFSYMDMKKPLPKRLEEFEGMRAVAGIGANRLSPYGIKAINSFVIVPEAPKIKKGPGIPEELVGKRLYVINRFPNYDNAPVNADRSDPFSGGRQVILISDHDSRLDIPWIPESIVRLLIAQIKGFQPEKQAPAFASQAASVGLSVWDLTTPHSDSKAKGSASINWAAIKNNRFFPIFILLTVGIIFFVCILIYRSCRRSK